MPRTRAAKTAKSEAATAWDELVNNEVTKLLNEIEQVKQKTIQMYQNRFLLQQSKIRKKYLDKTTAELAGLQSLTTLQTTTALSNEDVSTILSRTTVKKTSKKRSSSCTDDEGYLTTGSSSGSTRSRSRVKKSEIVNTRKSKSMTRMKTPMNRGLPPDTYGPITPKVKPSTPLLLLRRPKNGELAVSVQGSPLMTGSVVSDTAANINIPLVDGSLLSLQAQKGLRRSQLPDIDPEVKRQLELLRENLNIIL